MTEYFTILSYLYQADLADIFIFHLTHDPPNLKVTCHLGRNNSKVVLDPGTARA